MPRLSSRLWNTVTDWNWGRKSHEYLGPGLQPTPPGPVLSALANTLISIRHAQSNLNHIYFWVQYLPPLVVSSFEVLKITLKVIITVIIIIIIIIIITIIVIVVIIIY